MPIYHLNEGTVDLPSGWQDRTVHAFALSTGPTSTAASVTITREPLKSSDATLQYYIDRQLVELAKACPRFELIDRRAVTADGVDGFQLEYTWRTPDRVMVRQQQTVFLYRGEVLTVTASAPAAKFDPHAEAFRMVVESFRFRT